MDPRTTMGRRMDQGNLARSADDGARIESMDDAAAGGRFTRRAGFALAAGLLGLAATPSFATAFVQPIGPRTNHIVVSKSKRVLELRAGKEILKRYRIDLGFTPEGHKLTLRRRPHARGPLLDRPAQPAQRVLPQHRHQLSQRARRRPRPLAGAEPGGDIFIHGEPMRASKRSGRDWTAGCIAVTNDEIEEIWSMTPLGVPITILA